MNRNKTEFQTETEPWEFERDDLDPSDPIYKISRPYRIWHEYLRLSPTFAIAIKEYEGNIKKLTELDVKRNSDFPLQHYQDQHYELHEKRFYNRILTSDEKLRIPDDYEDVVKTFKAMTKGGLGFRHDYFKRWWISHAADIFGYRHAPSAVSIINTPHNAPLNLDEIIEALNIYSLEDRLKDGNTGFALVAIPLTGNKQNVMASVNELFENEEFTPIQKKWEALYTLEKGKQLEKLNIGLWVLWTRALNPNLPLWKVGLKANIRKEKDGDGYKGIDPDLIRQPEKYKDQIYNLETMTSRKLKESLIIMENAARGRFPCTDPNLISTFKKDQMLELVRESIRRRIRIEAIRLHARLKKRKIS